MCFCEFYNVDCARRQLQLTKKQKAMKNRVTNLLLLLLVSLTFTSCDIIEGIFKAGMGVGIFIVIAIIAVIVFIISKLGGSK